MQIPTFAPAADTFSSMCESASEFSVAALSDPAHKDRLEILLQRIAGGPGSGMAHEETFAEWDASVTEAAMELMAVLYVRRA